ncbi:MAG: DUF2480 family protein [Cyclobacteriaceae bacterium]
MSEIINKVAANESLVTLDLEELLDGGERVIFDLANALDGPLLREKDFREYVKTKDWSVFENKNVGVTCSVEAIIPSWAYMLIASKIQPLANSIVYGGEDGIEKHLIDLAVDAFDLNHLTGKKVILKGCSHIHNRDYAYMKATSTLVPVVTSLMYGEPCSTVPVFKAPKKAI